MGSAEDEAAPSETDSLLPEASRLKDSKSTENHRWRIACACCGFLADSYDLFTIDLVILILQIEYGSDMIGAAQKSLIVSMMLAGTIIGQLSFGCVGDIVGRKWAFVATAGLTIVGALLAGACVNRAGTLPLQLALCRFLLGIGVGGEYPLSATVTAETFSDAETRGQLMVFVISMQGFGMLLSACVALIALSCKLPLSYTWRLLCMFGAVPSTIAFILRWRMHETTAFEKIKSQTGASTSAYTWDTAKIISNYKKLLLGTALSWMLMNISLYSLGSFKSSILNDVMPEDGLSDEARVMNLAKFSAIVALFAILGFCAAFLFINRMGRFMMQLCGFSALTVLFAIIAFLDRVPTLHHGGMVFLMLLGITFFFQNFGPNTTTFIIAAEVFPTRVRSTCHGISAASGKFGAVIGTASFAPAAAAFGMIVVYVTCSIVACLGVAVTLLFTPRQVPELSELDDAMEVSCSSQIDQEAPLAAGRVLANSDAVKAASSA